jgi:hypothetical protein
MKVIGSYAKKKWLIAALSLIPAGILTPQYGGPSRTWWDAGVHEMLAWDDDYQDATGRTGIRNTTGAVNAQGHPFFEPLGINGRACVTCHQPANAMGLAAATARERWDATKGKDPLFAAVDGSNCPSLPQSTKESHSLLLDRGLFRIALPWPPRSADGSDLKPDFRIDVVSDPTGCNLSPIYGIQSSQRSVSVFRRPRIAANFNFVVKEARGFTLMADGREPTLRAQAVSAALGHEEAMQAPTEEQLRRIVEFESQIYAAQSSDSTGGLLYEPNGPLPLGPDSMEHGRGGLLDSDRPASQLSWVSFQLWNTPESTDPGNVQLDFRRSVARGSEIFSSKPIHLSAGREVTCSACHSSNSGHWFDIGTANHPAREAAKDLPLFRITCQSGQVIYTQDPGRALITGKCADAGALALPQFRGLSARAPYFTSGSAQSLREVVDYYDRRLHMDLSERAKRDLTNFLSVL